MPEGHTIHRLARDLAADLVGAPVRASSPQGRFAEGAAAVDGRVLERTDAHGKHLFLQFEGEVLIHVHLGLYGTFRRFAQPLPQPVGALRLRILGPSGPAERETLGPSGPPERETLGPSGPPERETLGPSGPPEREASGWDLRGATACELLGPAGKALIVARLGPDPLRRDADPERAWAALARRRSSVGQALMDQSVVSGVGNVYRAEVLFAHGIHPLAPANEVTREEWDAMWAWLVAALRRGVRERRIVTVDPRELGKARSRMTVAESRYVYKQPACLRCGTSVRRWDLAGRWAYACERCQPPSPRPAAAQH